jgi:hypothetical protein
MASENQGLQISLIIFVILTIVLSVTTFLFWKDASDQRTAFQSAETEKNNAQAAERQMMETTNNVLNLVAGAPSNEAGGTAATVSARATRLTTDFEADKQKWTTFPEDQHNYRAMTNYLYDLRLDLLAKLDAEQKKSMSLQSQYDELQRTTQAQLAESKRIADATQKDLQDMQARAKNDQDGQAQKYTELAATLQTKTQEYQAAQQQFNATTATLIKEQQTREGELLNTKNDLERVMGITPTPVDGQVVWVSQRGGVLLVNLGSDDYLPRQVGFSVYDRDTTLATNDTMKGKIEITRVIGPHMAEAKILDDDMRKPIIAGDKVASPLWDPGRQERFALVGFLDIDGDNRDDREVLRSLITMSGGIIDAEDTDKEPRNLTVDTRFIVVGAETKMEQEQVEKFSDLMREAEDLGVTKLNIADLLDQLGYKELSRLQEFGVGSDPKDFPPERPDGGAPVSTGSVSGMHEQSEGRGRFRVRQPPTPPAAGSSAEKKDGSQGAGAPPAGNGAMP